MDFTSSTGTIGVIGGMGPLATVDLYRKIVEETPATRDQDHVHVIIDADPKIPDRTAAIRGDGEDPLPRLIAAARRLEAAGAGLLIMPCNTAHAFLPAIRESIHQPILDMIEVAAARIAHSAPSATSVGVLATAGTVMSGLYDRALDAYGIAAIYPDVSGQQLVSEGIKRVKGGAPGEAADLFMTVARSLAAEGVDLLIAGCTEIPIVLDESSTPLPLVDPTRTLARAAVQWALDPSSGDIGEPNGARHSAGV
jgi:aspartate racemase